MNRIDAEHERTYLRILQTPTSGAETICARSFVFVGCVMTLPLIAFAVVLIAKLQRKISNIHIYNTRVYEHQTSVHLPETKQGPK